MSVKFLDGVPDVLYKYRNFKEEFHRSLLLKRELFFPTPNLFNDPYDVAIPLRYKKEDLTEDRIYLKYRELTTLENPKWSIEEVELHCYEHQRRGLLKDEFHVQKVREDTINMLAKSYGVVSLTSDPYNFLMWSHYASSHTGYCIGFDKHLLFEYADSKFANVEYHDKIPELGLFEHPLSSMHKLTYAKAKFWQYEKEFRITSIQNAKKKIELPIEAIKTVVLGLRMSQKEKFEVIDFVKSNYRNTEVYDLSLGRENFELVPMRVY